MTLSTVLASVLAVASAPSHAASVTVTLGNRTQTFSAGDITPNAGVAASDWQTAGAAERIPDALAVRQLVTLAGGDPDAVRAFSVALDGAAPTRLAGTLLAEGPPYGAGPPVPVLLWSDDADGVHFGRPVGPSQLSDRLDATGDSTLALSFDGGTRLRVHARTSRTRTESGSPLTFTAQLADPPPGRLTYTWAFGDGASARGVQVQHAYDRAGRYRPTVTVASPDARGSSEPIAIIVGRPTPSPRRTTRADAPTSSATRSSSSGPTAAPAPTPTAASEPPAATSRPAPTAAQSVVTPRRETADRRARSRRAATREGTSTAATLPTISGELLADAATTPAPAPPTAATAAATPADRGDEPEHLLAQIRWQGVAAVTLLTGGGLLEWRLGRRGVRP